jgi:ornithine decarboxylase
MQLLNISRSPDDGDKHFLKNVLLPRCSVAPTLDLKDEWRKFALSAAVGHYPEESVFVLDREALRSRVRLFLDGFLDDVDGVTPRMTYAAKVNPAPEYIEVMLEEGLTRFDCASKGEVDHLKDIAVNNGAEIECFYNQPALLFPRQTAANLRNGVRYFTVMDQYGLDQILEAMEIADVKPEDVMIAVRLGLKNNGAKISVSGKFAVDDDEMVQSLLREIEGQGFQTGLAMHLGSQNEDPATFAPGISKMADFAETYGGVQNLNVGGGIPANYMDNCFDAQDYLSVINDSIRAHKGRALCESQYGHKPSVNAEVGRAMVAESTHLISRVSCVRAASGTEPTRVHITDGVYHSFMDSILYEVPFNFKAFTLGGEAFSAESVSCRVQGVTCDDIDRIDGVPLPRDVQERVRKEAVWLTCDNMGAYSRVLSTKFCGRGQAPIYVY